METSMSIPAKSSFKFGELASLTGVKPYVLRFWETEFEEIKPLAAEDGSKTYSRSDVETILRIKSLLFDNKLSLQEAKVAIRDPSWAPAGQGIVLPSDHEAALNTLTEALTYVQSLKHKFRW
jgi:DNA-binding transcriptional MerR regulator